VGGEGVEPVPSSRFNSDLTQFLSDCEMDLGSHGKSHISEWGGGVDLTFRGSRVHWKKIMFNEKKII